MSNPVQEQKTRPQLHAHLPAMMRKVGISAGMTKTVASAIALEQPQAMLISLTLVIEPSRHYRAQGNGDEDPELTATDQLPQVVALNYS